MERIGIEVAIVENNQAKKLILTEGLDGKSNEGGAPAEPSGKLSSVFTVSPSLPCPTSPSS
jgi:hypothetical protein